MSPNNAGPARDSRMRFGFWRWPEWERQAEIDFGSSAPEFLAYTQHLTGFLIGIRFGWPFVCRQQRCVLCARDCSANLRLDSSNSAAYPTMYMWDRHNNTTRFSCFEGLPWTQSPKNLLFRVPFIKNIADQSSRQSYRRRRRLWRRWERISAVPWPTEFYLTSPRHGVRVSEIESQRFLSTVAVIDLTRSLMSRSDLS